MKRSPIPLFYTLVGLIAAALFVTAFSLNRRQHQASLHALQGSFEERLDREITQLAGTWDATARDHFRRFDPPDRIAEQCLEYDLFNIIDGRVAPACVSASTTQTVSRTEAVLFFTRGREALSLGDTVTARNAFTTAARSVIETPDDLYRVVSSRINLLDVASERSPAEVFVLASLLHAPVGVRLTDPQVSFFDSWLAENVADYERVRARNIQLWQRAKEIERFLQRQGRVSRALIGERLFARNETGQAFLDSKPWTDRWQPAHPVVLGEAKGSAAAVITRRLPVAPDRWLHIPASWIDSERQGVIARYRLTNRVLGLLLAASLLLVFGIARARKKERELDAMRAEFISTVSHELRTPLSLIRLSAETLYHDRIKPEKCKEYQQAILVEAERLGGLVNNVLDFSRLARGGYQPKQEDVDVSTLCEQVAESFRFRLEKEGIAFRSDITPGLTAHTDSLALSQVLFNLLDNAVKYSQEEKDISLSVTADGQTLEVRVADRGIGIPAELKDRIFQEFVRGSDQRVTAQRGSGIGLHVTRALVEASGGSIQVEENYPSGSVFVVRLPAMVKTEA